MVYHSFFLATCASVTHSSVRLLTSAQTEIHMSASHPVTTFDNISFKTTGGCSVDLTSTSSTGSTYPMKSAAPHAKMMVCSQSRSVRYMYVLLRARACTRHFNHASWG